MKGRFYVFTVLKINVKRNLSKDELINYFENNLDMFRDGTPSKPGMGFKVIKDTKYPENILNDEEIRDFSHKLLIIEYIQEIYSYQKILDKISRKLKRSKNKILFGYKKDYIFIKYPELLMFKGGKESYHLIWENFYNVANKVMEIVKEIKFSEEFFLKLLEKFWFKQNQIEENFTIDFFRDLSTEGEIDYMGKLVDVRQSYDITRSLPILISFLGKKKPRRGLFDFTLKSKAYSIEIYKDGTISPRQQLGIFKDITQNERALFGCYAIYKIVKYYEKWESLGKKEKYITIDFIKSLIDFCKEQGYNVFEGSIDIIKEYSSLRGEIDNE